MKRRPEEAEAVPPRRTRTKPAHMAATCDPEWRAELVRRLRPRYRVAVTTVQVRR